MYDTVTLHLPASVQEHKADIEYFFNTMLRKLETNSHKGWVKESTLAQLLKGLGAETVELVESVKKEGQFEAFVEASDVANMALLCGLSCIAMTKEDWHKRSIGEDELKYAN